jgi:dTDP-4-dehydrorhamnose 3,5-epimerase
VIDIDPLEDERGFFARAWCAREFAEHGLSSSFLQENIGFSSSAGTLRGLHFQRSPFEEAKLVRCTAGSAWDVAVDLRRGSPTYASWVGVELTAERRNMLYVAEGCAHGYITLADATEVRYLTSQFYEPEFVAGIRFDDASIGIDWPRAVTSVSDQDRSWPSLAEIERGVGS